jgi:hypothetical protein
MVTEKRAFEIYRELDIAILHTSEKHPTAYAIKFYKGVCGYCEPERLKELIEKEKIEDRKA